MKITVGIDLGTTNSVIARVDEHGRPAVIANAFGEAITPSVICFKDGEVIVGQEAKELQAAGEPAVAAFFKREMGAANYVFCVDDYDYTAIELSSLVLKKLKSDAESTLGGRITDAVITVPAYFRNPQREATMEAGRMAGLNVLQVINEPTAAAIAYGYKQAAEPQTLLVYDLGGGTFDVTLLRLNSSEIRILTSEGDHELGGKDWDDRIVEFLATRFRDEYGSDPFEDAISLGDLLVRAEETKKRLSSMTSAVVSIAHDGNYGRYDLDRATFERITSDLMERTISLTRKVLEGQRLQTSDSDGVLLVGGSTRMPMVHEFVTRTFGRPPITGVNVDEAVAFGAAIVAAERIAAETPAASHYALGGHRQTIDVTNHSLGMIALNEQRSAFINSLILPKDTPIPCTRTRPYQQRTRRTGENSVEIFMTQGESEAPADVSYLGKYVLHGIPHEEGGEAIIDVEYSYSISGTVEVTGRIRSSGQPLAMTVEPLPPDVPDRFLKPPQQTVAQPVTAYMAFDLSGSMGGRPLEEAQKAAKSFVQNSDLKHCSIGIIAFADSVKTKLEASQKANRIEEAINSLRIGETGGGNLAHPFDEARALLKRVSGPRFLITLADGVWSDQQKAIEAAKACHRDGIEVIAIGFGSADKAFLRAIASSDEASFFTNLSGLVETFTNIAQVLTESHGGKGTTGTAKSGTAKSFLSFLRGA